jgi:hypothetical protein
MGLILLLIIFLALFWGSWGGRGPYPVQYGYGFPWLVFILIVGVVLYLLGVPLPTVCLYIALIFAVLWMLQVPSGTISTAGAAITFLILSQLVGGVTTAALRLPHFGVR